MDCEGSDVVDLEVQPNSVVDCACLFESVVFSTPGSETYWLELSVDHRCIVGNMVKKDYIQLLEMVN